MIAKHKAALTSAVRSHDPGQLIAAVAAAVTELGAAGIPIPDPDAWQAQLNRAYSQQGLPPVPLASLATLAGRPDGRRHGQAGPGGPAAGPQENQPDAATTSAPPSATAVPPAAGEPAAGLLFGAAAPGSADQAAAGEFSRRAGELHAALTAIALSSAPSETAAGFRTGDVYLGQLLASLPPQAWTAGDAGTMPVPAAAWLLLGGYRDQLTELGISYDHLPVPPAAGNLAGDAAAAVREQALAAGLRARQDTYQPGRAWIRCDGPGQPAIMHLPPGADQSGELAAAAAALPGAVRDPGTGTITCPHAALPDLVALASGHDGITVPPEIRAQAAITAAGEPEIGPPAAEPAAAPPGSDPARITGEDLACALGRLTPAELTAVAAAGDRRPGFRWRQTSGVRMPGEPGAGSDETVTIRADGIDITVHGPEGIRQRSLGWQPVAGWLAPGLGGGRGGLLAQASQAHRRYRQLVHRYTVPGHSGHEQVRACAAELQAIAAAAQAAVIDAALAVNGPGPLPRRLASPAGSGPGAALFTPAAADDHAVQETAARVDVLAALLPAWPPGWDKPLAEVQPGDLLHENPGDPAAVLTVTSAPRAARLQPGGNAMIVEGTVDGADGPVTKQWIYYGADPATPVSYMPPGGPLTGPVPPPPAVASVQAAPPEPGTQLADQVAAAAGPPATARPAGPGGRDHGDLARQARAAVETARPGGPFAVVTAVHDTIRAYAAAAAPMPADLEAWLEEALNQASPAAERLTLGDVAALLTAGPAAVPSPPAADDRTHVPAPGRRRRPPPPDRADRGDLLAGVDASERTRELLTAAATSGLNPRRLHAADGFHVAAFGAPGGPLSGTLYISETTGDITSATIRRGTGPEEPLNDPAELLHLVRTARATAPGTGPAGPAVDPAAEERRHRGRIRGFMRRKHELRDALAAIAGQDPGFGPQDAYLGHLLAASDTAQWGIGVNAQHPPEEGTAAWLILAGYQDQLGHAGISYGQLPVPPAADTLPASRHSEIRQQALGRQRGIADRDRSRAVPGLYCEGTGQDILVHLPAGPPDSDLAADASALASAGYDPGTGTCTCPLSALHAAVAFADQHSIPVTPEARALAATTAAPPPAVSPAVTASPAAGSQRATAECAACGTTMIMLEPGQRYHPTCVPEQDDRSGPAVARTGPDPGRRSWHRSWRRPATLSQRQRSRGSHARCTARPPRRRLRRCVSCRAAATASRRRTATGNRTRRPGSGQPARLSRRPSASRQPPGRAS